MCPLSPKTILRYFPKRLELLLRKVFALPKLSKIGLDCSSCFSISGTFFSVLSWMYAFMLFLRVIDRRLAESISVGTFFPVDFTELKLAMYCIICFVVSVLPAPLSPLIIID